MNPTPPPPNTNFVATPLVHAQLFFFLDAMLYLYVIRLTIPCLFAKIHYRHEVCVITAPILEIGKMHGHGNCDFCPTYYDWG